MRFVVDQRVFQTSVQLARILNVERVATDTPAMLGVKVRHECDRTELETKRQWSTGVDGQKLRERANARGNFSAKNGQKITPSGVPPKKIHAQTL